ncbi:sugar transferase [Liquorilactobacillus satsumensis]|nr:sugar transferase [Liquorilactobacillus satsumensis]MCC7666551.1 beta-1,6-galactofuranosyltransferase [Liquorilactobacillus satsumensis]MCP9357483.1 sugar transferase [Liquorilactobacillus satsumensis]MCP9371311.1 sugar transferase [Liquorilactobacillus satsumensis]
MNKYVISMYDKGQNEAGPKAKVDVVRFLQNDGFTGIEFYFNGRRKAELMSIIQTLWDIPHRLRPLPLEVVLFQYPAFNERTNKKIVTQVRKQANSKLFYLLHDVEALRLRRNDKLFLQKEINFFNQSDGLIVHNDKMLGWLKENGVVKPMVSLQLFDYDNPQPLLEGRPFDRSMCFAGNLGKASFLNKLQLNHSLELFGPNQQASYQQNIHYCGSYSPEVLPQKLTQNFGLIWDGSSLEKCDGVFGEYLRYNDPHKASLYLSSGLPVIIWKEAALAEFVRRHGLGLVISNLHELDASLEAVSQDEYQRLCANVRKIAQKLRTGQFIRQAWHELMSKEQENKK